MVLKERGFSSHLIPSVRWNPDASNPHSQEGFLQFVAFFLCTTSSYTTDLVVGVRKCCCPALGADGSIPSMQLQLLHPPHRHKAAAVTDLPKEPGENWEFM